MIIRESRQFSVLKLPNLLDDPVDIIHANTT